MKQKVIKYLKSIPEYAALSKEDFNQIVIAVIETFQASKKTITEQKKNKEISAEEAKIRLYNIQRILK